MTIIYDVIAKRHKGSPRPDIVLFYDEDREEAIKFMSQYRRKHGFTIEEKEGRFSIADLILRERESTGKLISETQYCKLFNVFDKRIS